MVRCTDVQQYLLIASWAEYDVGIFFCSFLDPIDTTRTMIEKLCNIADAHELLVDRAEGTSWAYLKQEIYAS